jgi:hypothetical protein
VTADAVRDAWDEPWKVELPRQVQLMKGSTEGIV